MNSSKAVNKPPVEELRRLWLSGMSLRDIGHVVGMSYEWVRLQLISLYGKDATNVRQQSLSRVVYQEYGDLKTAEEAANSPGLFRTARVEKNFSKHLTYDAMVPRVSYEEPEEPVTYLTLPLFIRCFQLLSQDLFTIFVDTQ